MKVLVYSLAMSPPGRSIPHSMRNVAPLVAVKVTLLDAGHDTLVGEGIAAVRLIVELLFAIDEVVFAKIDELEMGEELEVLEVVVLGRKDELLVIVVEFELIAGWEDVVLAVEEVEEVEIAVDVREEEEVVGTADLGLLNVEL